MKQNLIIIILFILGTYFQANAQDSLRLYLGDIPEKYFGTAVADASNEAFFQTMYNLPGRTYTKKIIYNFNALTAGNEMKFYAIHPQPDVFALDDGDKLCYFGEQHGLLPRGHTLVWHAQLPSWLGAGTSGYENNNGYTRDSLLSILKHHITTIVTHYKGRIKEWDVVNEPFEGDGSLRKSIWQQVIGDEYIDSAFVWAHQADPDAILVLNEYGAEPWGTSKSNGMFNKIKSLVENGIPVHAAGFQCHATLGQSNFTMIKNNMERYHEIGVSCVITELDIRIPASQMGTQSAWDAQAADYVNYVKLMTETDYCHGIVVWGFTDKYSWIPAHTNYTAGEACLFNDLLNPKPAYYAIEDYFRAYLGYDGVNQELKYKPFELITKYNELYIHLLNPAFTIKQARIFNTIGQQVDVISAQQLVGTSYPLSHLNNGVYILVITDGTNQNHATRFFKQ
ncbi:MAG: endo-1,4-beta-xylanase [Salinivirgaceae bacterium]